jgi:argininosuccinate lyase / amino-acid N-acetyltransferase
VSAERPQSQVWRGRLGGLDPRAQFLNDSLPVDRRLWPEELILSRAYASALAEAGVLSPAEHAALVSACDSLEADLASGATTLVGEDVHSAVEAELTKRCGEPGRRLHTGRSRNDQVSTLLRLHVMRLAGQSIEGVKQLERALVGQARRSGSLAVAAYTHLQPAQPVLLAHWWLAHAAAFERDEARFETAREAADLMPLGAGAVAGTPLVYDRLALAGRLGFSRLVGNSLDAVGDRDFALEYLNAASVLGIHLSRLAEDLVLWCSPGFGWFDAPDGFSTGSSLLPQKRNPDLFELTRGKAGRLLANAQRLAITLKGLPSAYQKDLQEDKEAVFDTADTLSALLAVLPAALDALKPRPERLAASLTPGLLAVELADALVAEGVPFRDAHVAVGRLWAEAERQNIEVAALSETDRLALSPHFTDARLAALTVDAALERRTHAPGAGPASVQEQLERQEARLGIGDGDPEGIDDAHPHPVHAKATQRTTPAAEKGDGPADPDAIVLRRAQLEDVPGITGIMASYVAQGILLPRPVSELYQCVREFHVAEHRGQIVACAALRILWDDLGEVRSLAVRPDYHGKGLGAQLTRCVIDDARAFNLPRVIALTREVEFFESCGFTVLSRDVLPRKVWTDCVRCPKRHACDEVAVVLDLQAGATAAAAASGKSWVLPIPQLGPQETLLPIIS